MDKFTVEEMKFLKDLYAPRQLKGMFRCVRCRDFDWLYPAGICSRCIDLLKTEFPDIYEQARQENIKLFDEGKQKYYENGIKTKDDQKRRVDF